MRPEDTQRCVPDPARDYEDRFLTATQLHDRFLENLSILQLDWYVENYRDPVIPVDGNGDPAE